MSDAVFLDFPLPASPETGEEPETASLKMAKLQSIACGWVLCVGRRTISRVIQVEGLDGAPRHHSVFYRFFSRANFFPTDLGKYVLALVLKLLPKDARIVLTVDDTLCRKSGAQIWGGAMHHDALLSNYGRGKSSVKVFSFGHNWVIVCICIQTPWNKDRFMAIPIAWSFAIISAPTVHA